LFCSGVHFFVEGLAPVGFDLDEEGVGSGCHSFLKDLYDFPD
jgi:hypothetical protein